MIFLINSNVLILFVKVKVFQDLKEISWEKVKETQVQLQEVHTYRHMLEIDKEQVVIVEYLQD